MTAEELQERTKQFALDAVRFVKGQPDMGPFGAVVRQLVRSATSVAANYRAACRARSRVEFAARLGVVSEESDETVFWLELMVRGRLVRGSAASLLEEARQLRAIMAASAKTARKNLNAVKK